MKSYSYGMTPDHVIAAALEGKRYPMELVGEDIDHVIAAVNVGIDAHLTAITNSRFDLKPDRFSGRRLHCDVSPADMLVLLRRLNDSEHEDAQILRGDILSTLELEEI